MNLILINELIYFVSDKPKLFKDARSNIYISSYKEHARLYITLHNLLVN